VSPVPSRGASLAAPPGPPVKVPQVLQQRWRQDNVGGPPPRAVGTVAAGTAKPTLKRVQSTPCSLQLTPRYLGRGEATGTASSAAAAVVAAAICSRRQQHGQLSEWTVEQVSCWARSTRLPAGVAELLRENAVNGQVLQSLTEEDLQAMGLSKFGWRRQLLLCREELEQRLQDEENDDEPDEEESCTRVGTPHGIAAGLSSAPATPSGSNSRSLLPLPASAAAAAVGPPLQQSLHRAAQEQSPPASMDEHTRMPLGSADWPVGASKMPCAFLVDNSVLQSEQEGLEFHHVPNSSSNSCQVCVPWGTVIHGIPLGNDWLQVGDFFLPMHLNGVVVLTRERHCLPTGVSANVAVPSPQCGGSARARTTASAMPLHTANGSRNVSSVKGSSVSIAAPLSSASRTRVGSSVVMRPRVQSPPAAAGGHGSTVYCAPRLSLRQCMGPLPPAMIPTPARAVASCMAQRGVSCSYSTLPKSSWMTEALPDLQRCRQWPLSPAHD